MPKFVQIHETLSVNEKKLLDLIESATTRPRNRPLSLSTARRLQGIPKWATIVYDEFAL